MVRPGATGVAASRNCWWMVDGCAGQGGWVCWTSCPPTQLCPPPTVLPQGITTEYMQHRKRRGRLERAGQLYNEPDLKMPPLAEYTLLRLRSAYLDSQSSPVVACLPSAVGVFSGGADKLMGGDPTARQSHDARVRQLGRQLFAGGEPALGSPEFAVAVAALATFEIGRLQTSLQQSAQQVQLFDDLIVPITGHPGEQGKVRRSKQRLQDRMGMQLRSLLRWLAGGYDGSELLPADVRERGVAAAFNANEWTVGVTLFLGGVFWGWG